MGDFQVQNELETIMKSLIHSLTKRKLNSVSVSDSIRGWDFKDNKKKTKNGKNCGINC